MYRNDYTSINIYSKICPYELKYRSIDLHLFRRYNLCMIKGFSDKETELIYNQKFSKKLPESIQKIALRKLIMIDNAESLNDLRIPPSNHLEQLQGDRKGQYSIRINDSYRICFTVTAGGFKNVEIVNYH